MATPFTAFRKYTGVMMAVLCVLLMISFVVADALPGWAQGGPGGPGSGAGAVVAKWRGGSLNERQLGEALLHRGVLEAFQRRLVGMGIQSAQAAGVEDLPLRVTPLTLPTTSEQGVERDIVNTKVFAQRATEAGMIVSDETVTTFLQALGRDRVSIDQMRTIIAGLRVGAGRRATTAFLFDLVREKLLERNYRNSHLYLFSTVLPAEQWDDWMKVNRRIVLEAAPLEVSDFIDEVEDPSEEELAEFYEQYRDREPAPDFLRDYGNVELPSPEPGFTTPERVRVQYVTAKFNDFVDRALPEVTDEEVAKFYEENKEQFISADASLFGDDSLFDDDEPASEEGESSGDEEQSPADASDEAGAPPAGPAESEADIDSEVGDNTPVEGDDSTSEPAEEQPAEETDATDIAEELIEEEEEEEQADVADETGEETQSEPTDQEAGGDSVVYQPLDEVEEDIRTVIAQAKAAEAMQAELDELRRQVRDEYDKYFDATLDAEDAGKEPPAPPETLTNLEPLALENGLEHGSLAPARLLDLRETTVGKSLNTDPTRDPGLPFWIMAFQEGRLDVFEPAVTFDPANRDRMLVIVSERIPRETPELDDIRDKVVTAWKVRQAAEVALARAEELATEAETAGQPLAEFFADSEDVGPFETDPLSFLTIGSISQTTGRVSLRLSQPESLVAAGPEMLRKAFDLGPGEVAAALNHDRSIAYVLRVAQALGTPEELRAEFTRDGAAWYGEQSTRMARAVRAEMALQSNLAASAEVELMRGLDGNR